MEFNDPSGYKLQQYTGAYGWRLDVGGDSIVTYIFGYPNGGDMPNCPRDGLHFCALIRKHCQNTKFRPPPPIKF